MVFDREIKKNKNKKVTSKVTIYLLFGNSGSEIQKKKTFGVL